MGSTVTYTLVGVSGRFTHAGAAGANRFRFRGRIGGRALAPGRYRLVGSPPRVGTTAGTPRRIAFRIKG
jgi:hypothetical protein